MKKTQRGWNSTIRPGKPPQRKTPLKRSAPPKRTKSVAKRSEKAQGMDGWRRQERAAVILRAQGGIAHGWKGCEVVFPVLDTKERPTGFQRRCSEIGEHVHHNFGRTGEPFASWRHLCTLVCFAHHGEVTGQVGSGLDRKLRMQLRVAAAQRVHHAFQPAVEGQLSLWTNEDWIAWLMMFIGNMKLYGQLPPEYKG